jgi:plastocyanin
VVTFTNTGGGITFAGTNPGSANQSRTLTFYRTGTATYVCSIK